VDEHYPLATAVMNKIGRERGWRPTTQARLEQQRFLRGSDFVGSPDEIIEKILFQHDIFKHQRFLLYMGNNAIEHQKMMRAIELFGTKVAPVVRQEIARRNVAKT
jgi:alkanesulfonate monooxygenase SsuD/methylene tetrahydromethanopterin reductase-like flavin-dependent oxidoreductase (luciferase family)